MRPAAMAFAKDEEQLTSNRHLRTSTIEGTSETVEPRAQTGIEGLIPVEDQARAPGPRRLAIRSEERLCGEVAKGRTPRQALRPWRTRRRALAKRSPCPQRSAVAAGFRGHRFQRRPRMGPLEASSMERRTPSGRSRSLARDRPASREGNRRARQPWLRPQARKGTGQHR
jgi:hypothetical protein